MSATATINSCASPRESAMGERADTLFEAFDVVARLGIALDAAPLTKHADCWVCQIDVQWLIAVNGHDAPRNFRELPVEPFHCYVEFNGWPAGIFNPRGGSIAAGECANEDTFIAAIRARLALIHPSPTTGAGE